MRDKFCVRTLAVAALVLAHYALPQKQQPPVFEGRVEMVIVDVYVTDKKGKAVPGLTQADFEIFEEGQRQTIEYFEAFQVADPIYHEARASADAPVVSTPRLFAIVVDDLGLRPQLDITRARKAAEQIVHAAADDDEILLVTTSAKTTILERLPDGRERLLLATQGIEGLLIPTLMDPAEARRRVWLHYETVEGTLQSMVDVKKPKSLTVIARGFVHLSQTFNEWRTPYKKIIESSRRSNTPMYFVSVRGLESRPPPFHKDASTGIMRSGGSGRNVPVNITESLALETGGLVIRNPDLAPRIVEEMRASYLIGYYPKNEDHDGKFREIEAKIKKKGLKVRARKGYYAPTDGRDSQN
jgi:VWFA-related protein